MASGAGSWRPAWGQRRQSAATRGTAPPRPAWGQRRRSAAARGTVPPRPAGRRRRRPAAAGGAGSWRPALRGGSARRAGVTACGAALADWTSSSPRVVRAACALRSGRAPARMVAGRGRCAGQGQGAGHGGDPRARRLLMANHDAEPGSRRCGNAPGIPMTYLTYVAFGARASGPDGVLIRTLYTVELSITSTRGGSGRGRGRHRGPFGLDHSHSMVAGGLLVTSRTTRLTWGTSLVTRVEIRARTSAGSRAQSAVIASSLVTGRRTSGWP